MGWIVDWRVEGIQVSRFPKEQFTTVNLQTLQFEYSALSRDAPSVQADGGGSRAVQSCEMYSYFYISLQKSDDRVFHELSN